MAIIPLKQSVIVYYKATENEWGEVESMPPVTLKCRVDEKTEYVKNLASSTLNAEIISNVQIIFDKLPNISYEDTIEFTNELGVKMSGKPLLIEPIRMINGKAALTTVYL